MQAAIARPATLPARVGARRPSRSAVRVNALVVPDQYGWVMHARDRVCHQSPRRHRRRRRLLHAATAAAIMPALSPPPLPACSYVMASVAATAALIQWQVGARRSASRPAAASLSGGCRWAAPTAAPPPPHVSQAIRVAVARKESGIKYPQASAPLAACCMGCADEQLPRVAAADPTPPALALRRARPHDADAHAGPRRRCQLHTSPPTLAPTPAPTPTPTQQMYADGTSEAAMKFNCTQRAHQASGSGGGSGRRAGGPGACGRRRRVGGLALAPNGARLARSSGCVDTRPSA